MKEYENSVITVKIQKLRNLFYNAEGSVLF